MEDLFILLSNLPFQKQPSLYWKTTPLASGKRRKGGFYSGGIRGVESFRVGLPPLHRRCRNGGVLLFLKSPLVSLLREKVKRSRARKRFEDHKGYPPKDRAHRNGPPLGKNKNRYLNMPLQGSIPISHSPWPQGRLELLWIGSPSPPGWP